VAKDTPIVKDEIAKRNLELTIEAVASGEYGQPHLDLDTAAFRAFRDGDSDVLPPECNPEDPAQAFMFDGVRGATALCLAGGGGQQSAIWSLLGASVTVLDLTPEQLERDQIAARCYGYSVATIQGDMRDLSVFADWSFNRVIQPISTLYVPDLREVYAGVARVLTSGGLYRADFVYPPLYMVEDKGWDGHGYVLRFSQPHKRGPVLERESDDLMNFDEGVSFGEFNHLLSDIINGLIAEGLRIKGIWETPRPRDISSEDLANLVPPADSAIHPWENEHRNAIIPMGLSVVAEKC
jgi:SAM-dependent methyltransferase